MKYPRPILLLPFALLLASPAFASERATLRGELWDQPVEATLDMEAHSTELSAVISAIGGSVRLTGTLDEEGVGNLSSTTGLVQAFSAMNQTERWKARLTRDGPLVRLLLSSNYRSVVLEGLVDLGPTDRANEDLIRRFYQAFVDSDGETMASCYGPDAHFTDPTFPNLRGDEPGDMWRMLCESAPQVVFSDIRADGRYAVAHWEADYELFGNKIHNVIEARFEIREGKIVRHVDQFDFKAWSIQAFGPVMHGLPSGAVRFVVRRFTASTLKTFREERAAAQTD